MDCSKTGALLLRLRKERGLTQMQVAEKMNISDKTISKWERGLGCPDVSLLRELSNLFEINIEKLLSGDLESNMPDAGNFRRMKFYVCPVCSNVMNNTGNAEIYCCGRKLAPLTAKPSDDLHSLDIQDTDGEYYITFHHEMSKTHYISFVAYITNEKLLLIKLYPEQEPSVHLAKMDSSIRLAKSNSKLLYYCTMHGLFAV